MTSNDNNLSDGDERLRSQNFSLFRDCLASRVLFIFSNPGSDTLDDEDLAEFSEYLAAEVWPSLPESIQELSHASAKPAGVPPLDALADASSRLSLSPAFADTLVSYALVPAPSEDDRVADADAPYAFVRKVLEAYIPLATAPPPVWSSTRASECEVCERAVPLTYHHLIPRSVHTKALKRGWHTVEMLNSVAWLCRPCHSVVHSVASCEVLAREYYTVERLLDRDDIQKWRKYASKQRWDSQRIRRTKEREVRI